MKNPKTTLIKNLLTGRQAFSMAEVVIVVSVLGILIGMSFPAVTRYMMQRDVQLEQNRMTEIKSGLKAYLADRNQLPSVSNWAADLAGGYTNLSQDQILKDVWDRPRALRMYEDNTRNVQGSAVPVNYLSLHSMGVDGVVTAVSGVAVVGGAFGTTNTGWWNNPSLPVSSVINGFSNLTAGGDDIMIKLTDYSEKLGNYETTVQRVDRITEALQAFARSQYSAKVAECNANPSSDTRCTTAGALELINYFPRSESIAATEVSINSNNAAWNYINSSIVVDNGEGVATRRNQMQNLMRTLGLPIDYCCSALVVNTTDNLPEPFYYFSNPRPRSLNGTDCGTRPQGSQAKLSPRVVTGNVADGQTNPTCG